MRKDVTQRTIRGLSVAAALAALAFTFSLPRNCGQSSLYGKGLFGVLDGRAHIYGDAGIDVLPELETLVLQPFQLTPNMERLPRLDPVSLRMAGRARAHKVRVALRVQISAEQIWDDWAANDAADLLWYGTEAGPDCVTDPNGRTTCGLIPDAIVLEMPWRDIVWRQQDDGRVLLRALHEKRPEGAGIHVKISETSISYDDIGQGVVETMYLFELLEAKKWDRLILPPHNVGADGLKRLRLSIEDQKSLVGWERAEALRALMPTHVALADALPDTQDTTRAAPGPIDLFEDAHIYAYDNFGGLAVSVTKDGMLARTGDFIGLGGRVAVPVSHAQGNLFMRGACANVWIVQGFFVGLALLFISLAVRRRPAPI